MSKYRYGHFLFSTFIALVFISIDWITKNKISGSFQLYEKRDVIPGFFSLYYVRNTGSAFSMLADKSWGITVLSVVSVIMAAVIFYLLTKAGQLKDTASCVALTLLLAGAVGNLIDRIVYRSVVDFLRFDFGSYTFPIFNVADICAVCGTVLFVIMILFQQKKVDKILVKVENDLKSHRR
ncbi:MAG: signal peptidase II [Clostridiales bacterium]|nr:signal peptidase II [Clostridiales bacterium]